MMANWNVRMQLFDAVATKVGEKSLSCDAPDQGSACQRIFPIAIANLKADWKRTGKEDPEVAAIHFLVTPARGGKKAK